MSYNPFSLEGKTILVTGASSGIGKATAIECSRMGATLVITGRHSERLQETFTNLAPNSAEHQQVVADLVTEEGVNALISSLKKIDGVVLCAGRGCTLPFQFASREKFDEIFNINFFSQTELLRLLYKKKILNKGASVVIIDSIGGTKRYSNGNSIYGASKAALLSIMKFCAREFASRKIRVNCLCPGMVETPLIHKGSITEEQLQADIDRYPLKRYGHPEDIAYSAIYLLSDASSWVTGHDLVIDGGCSI